MATWTGNGPNSRTFVSNIKTGERSWQVDLETHNHSEIREMQQKLSSFGFSTQGADGTYGNNTKNAVINFQRAFPTCGTPDGYFGKNTLNTFVSKVGSLAGYTGPGSGGATDQINVGDTVITILPAVNFRSSPSGVSLFQVATGTTMVVTEVTASGGYTWYGGVISSQTGYLRGDCIEKYSSGTGVGSIAAGRYVKMNQSNSQPVNVRASTSTSSERLGRLQKGTLMYCEEVVNSTWVKIRWGGQSQSYAYIMSQYLIDGGEAASSKVKRAFDIGNSMAVTSLNDEWKYPNSPDEYFDIGHGAWCVKFVSFLQKAAGCSSSNYVPFTDALVSEAVAFFSNKGTFGTVAQGRTPREGDWIFYSKGNETYQHVGLVTEVDGLIISTVEGNMDGTVQAYRSVNYRNTIHNMTVYGFATPTWS